MTAQKTAESKLWNLMQALADSTAEISDDELREDIEASGENLEALAANTRAVLLGAVKKSRVFVPGAPGDEGEAIVRACAVTARAASDLIEVSLGRETTTKDLLDLELLRERLERHGHNAKADQTDQTDQLMRPP